MTREQTIRLAKSVKGIASITQDLLILSQEILLDSPKDTIEIAEPMTAIALNNEKLMEVARKHSKQYIDVEHS